MTKFFKISAFLIILILMTGCASPQIKSIRGETVLQTPEPVLTDFVNIGADGCSPPIIFVTAGETVTFKNLDSKAHEIASDPYPKDDILPDFHSEVLYNNETYRYIFKTAGTFGYHLEENPSIKGKVVVE